MHAQKLISASAYASVCCRSRKFLGRIQPMSNVHLPFVSVYQRMTDFVHTLAYAGVIRNSVKWVLHLLAWVKVQVISDVYTLTLPSTVTCHQLKLGWLFIRYSGPHFWNSVTNN